MVRISPLFPRIGVLLLSVVSEVLPGTEQDTEERGYGILVMKTDTLRCSAIQHERERSVSQQEAQPYDSLLDQNPYLQEQRALERALGRNEGITQGIQKWREAIVEITQRRFPTLVEVMRQR